MRLHEAHFYGFRFSRDTVFKLKNSYYRVLGNNYNGVDCLVLHPKDGQQAEWCFDIDYLYENGETLSDTEELLYGKVG